jgi:hypothetical protein
LINKEKEGEANGSLPLLNPSYNKGGNVIIQSWSTRSEVPPEIPFSYLPIIVDPKKLYNNMNMRNSLGLPDLAEKMEAKRREELL